MNLVIGASGQLGNLVAKRLLESGQPVRAHSRDPDTKLPELKSLGAEAIKGDLRDPNWIDDAMSGVQHVLIASQGLFPPSRTNHAATVDEPGNRRVINAAKQAGVEHIVFISMPHASPEFPSRFVHAKHQTEEDLKRSGVGHTILQSPVFIEAHGIVMLGEPLRSGNAVQFFGRGQTPLRWISVEDVASYVLRSFEDPELCNTTRVIGGPDIMTRVQVLERIEKELGTQAKRRHMPLTLMRVMRTATKPVHPGLSDLISLAIAEETMPDHPGFAPEQLDWQGSQTVDDVVRRWAAVTFPKPAAAD